MSIIQISATELKTKLELGSKPLLLDVREADEFEYTHIEGSLHIPMNQIPQKLEQIDSNVECIVICHHGIRSQYVASFLVSAGYTQIYNLNGGIDAWSVECDNTVSRY